MDQDRHDALLGMLQSMHNTRWVASNDLFLLRLGRPYQLDWCIELKPRPDSMRLALSWQVPGAGYAHATHTHLDGSDLEIVQQVMARINPIQRSVELAFDQGVRSALSADE